MPPGPAILGIFAKKPDQAKTRLAAVTSPGTFGPGGTSSAHSGAASNMTRSPPRKQGTLFISSPLPGGRH